MSHRSRLGALVIDCQGGDLAEAARFWGAALGSPVRLDSGDPRYAAIHRPADEPKLIVQRVEHGPRVHIDIETDDQEAERTRLEALGARLVERHPKGWIIMEAPTHRFCLVDPSRADFPGDAREHPQ